MYFYQRLKDLREDKDLKQKDIASIINTTSNYYGDYEKGKRDIPTSRMLQLADFYQVSMDYITGRTNDKGGLHKNSTAEQELLSNFNKLSELSKGRILGMIQVLLEQQGEQAEHKADGTQIKNNISINQNNGKVKINNK